MAKRNRYMKEAVEELERLNADKELRYLYLERLKAASDEATMQSTCWQEVSCITSE